MPHMSVVAIAGMVAVACNASARAQSQTFVSMPMLQGDPVPGLASTNFGSATSSPAINAANSVAFWNRYNVTEGALFNSAGSMHIVVKGNDPAPGGGLFGPVTGPVFTLADTGAAAFVHSISGGGTSLGIWSETGSGLTRIAYNDLVAPSSPPGTFILEGSQLLSGSNAGHLAFTCISDATGTGRTYITLFSGKPGSLAQHARQDAPPSSTGITSLSTVIQINSAGAACLGGSFISDAPHSGILAGASGGLQVIAATGQDAPGVVGQPLPGVKFKSIGAYGFNGVNAVAFLAALEGGGYTGEMAVYIKDAAGLRQLYVANAQVPGEPGGTLWGTFNPPLLCDNGEVILQANVYGPATNSSNQSGIWRVRNDILTRICRAGQAVPDVPGATLGLSSSTAVAANAFGQIAFSSTFDLGGNVQALFGTDRSGNLVTVYKAPDKVTVRPGMIRSFTSFSNMNISGGNDGRLRSLNDSGYIACSASVNIPPGQPFGQNGRAILLFHIAARCPGDLNNDAMVDDADFVLFVAAYNVLDCADPAMPLGCPADLNADGFVDDADFVLFVPGYDALVCP